jgi:transketolase
MVLNERRILELETTSRNLRRTILEMIHTAGSGHMGGSLSCVEILTALYFEELNFDPQNPKDPKRDRFILSKGHAAPALYAVLALLGLVPRQELLRLRKLGSPLQGHPDMKSVPGVEISSGPLGFGLSVGAGIALSARMDGLNYRTYVLLGDGEIQEGIIWEGAMTASKYKLNNLVAILDNNGVQLDGTCEEVMPMGEIAAKFHSFGWNIIECDGHSIPELAAAFLKAKQYSSGPSVIIARTVKGKGISFMEGQNIWHGKLVDDASYQQAVVELGGESYAE